jgi:hypothetical protein
MQENKTSLPDLLTETQLCRYLGKSKAWAQRARFEGTGPRYVKAGRKPLYTIEAVSEWLRASERENTAVKGRKSKTG